MREKLHNVALILCSGFLSLSLHSNRWRWKKAECRWVHSGLKSRINEHALHNVLRRINEFWETANTHSSVKPTADTLLRAVLGKWRCKVHDEVLSWSCWDVQLLGLLEQIRAALVFNRFLCCFQGEMRLLLVFALILLFLCEFTFLEKCHYADMVQQFFCEAAAWHIHFFLFFWLHICMFLVFQGFTRLRWLMTACMEVRMEVLLM